MIDNWLWLGSSAFNLSIQFRLHFSFIEIVEFIKINYNLNAKLDRKKNKKNKTSS